MKTKCMGLIVCVVCASASAYAGPNVQWGAETAASYLYNAAGTQLTTDGLLVQLIADVGGTTDYEGMISSGYVGIGADTETWLVAAYDGDTYNTSDDKILASGTWVDLGDDTFGAANTTTDLLGQYYSTELYIRWFNKTNLGDSDQAGLIWYTANVGASTSPDTAWKTPADGAPGNGTLVFDYGVSGIDGSKKTGTNAGWQTVAPVPEPTTMGLMAVGMLTVLARRRFAKK